MEHLFFFSLHWQIRYWDQINADDWLFTFLCFMYLHAFSSNRLFLHRVFCIGLQCVTTWFRGFLKTSVFFFFLVLIGGLRPVAGAPGKGAPHPRPADLVWWLGHHGNTGVWDVVRLEPHTEGAAAAQRLRQTPPVDEERECCHFSLPLFWLTLHWDIFFFVGFQMCGFWITFSHINKFSKQTVCLPPSHCQELM